MSVLEFSLGWVYGWIRCKACSYRYMNVSPVELDLSRLECPSCGDMTEHEDAPLEHQSSGFRPFRRGTRSNPGK